MAWNCCKLQPRRANKYFGNYDEVKRRVTFHRFFHCRKFQAPWSEFRVSRFAHFKRSNIHLCTIDFTLKRTNISFNYFISFRMPTGDGTERELAHSNYLLTRTYIWALRIEQTHTASLCCLYSLFWHRNEKNNKIGIRWLQTNGEFRQPNG